MNFGRTATIGRYVVDIDGCLRGTDFPSLTSRDVIALHGGLPNDTHVLLEVYDDTRPLNAQDRIALSEETVTFFRTVEVPQRIQNTVRWHVDMRTSRALAA